MVRALSARGLVVAYDGTPVLEGVSLDLETGEVVALLGPNGAGKTSLLKALAGLLPHAGRVWLLGEEVSRLSAPARASRGLAWIPEEPRAFPNLTVEEHLTLALELAGRPGRGLEQATRLFPSLHGQRKRRAASLSGGERKILSVAAAVIRRPRVLLADDPFLGLFHDQAEAVRGALIGVAEAGGAVLLAGQQPETLVSLASRAYLLVGGSIVEEGRPRDVLLRAASLLR